MKIIEHVEQCRECQGTGLYLGFAERDGIAVVCRNCKGTGASRYRHEYEEFKGRREREDVVRVLRGNPGIIVGSLHGNYSRFGGMSYFDWTRGEPFSPGSEMRDFVCPAWWYQSVDGGKKPHWKECGFGAFSECKHFPDKASCWTRWDKEFGPAAKDAA